MTWRISNSPSPTITRSISNCKISCFSASVAPSSRDRIRSQNAVRSANTARALDASWRSLACCSRCSVKAVPPLGDSPAA